MKRLLKMQGHEVPMQNDELVKANRDGLRDDLEMMRRFLEYKRGKPIKKRARRGGGLLQGGPQGRMLIDKLEVRTRDELTRRGATAKKKNPDRFGPGSLVW